MPDLYWDATTKAAAVGDRSGSDDAVLAQPGAVQVVSRRLRLAVDPGHGGDQHGHQHHGQDRQRQRRPQGAPCHHDTVRLMLRHVPTIGRATGQLER